MLTIIFSFNIFSYYNNDFLLSLRSSVFTTVSLVTTTGFSVVDYDLWPASCKVIIFFLLFLGGCAGSTTGAMKIIRTILVGKVLACEMKKLIHPKGVFSIKIGDNTIDDNVIKNTLGFYLFYIFIFILAALIFSLTVLGSRKSFDNKIPFGIVCFITHTFSSITDVIKWFGKCALLKNT